jgi:putative transposase
VDQGRFKSFPVQEDEHFYTVCRYVERNALRANLAPGAERWRGGSLHRWKLRYGEGKVVVGGLAMPRWPGWVEHVNGPQTEAELAALRRCVQRGSPFGEGVWCDQIVRRLGLESTLRPPRPPQETRKRFLTPRSFLPHLFFPATLATLRRTSVAVAANDR